ncbi:PTS transporter subunit EIIC [Collinsella tanakaei]|uniref:PTS transporter subunit EIIC n=1 Tax=Collinsella tanakaei TaxID=626935 RepID=UPI002F945F94
MSMQETASRILQEVGGEENVDNLTHCVTRLRFTLKSTENVDEGRVKAIPGVLGVVNQGGQFQVIIGQEVASAYNEILKLGTFSTSTPLDINEDDAPKKGVVNRILDTVAGIFSPIMPVIAGVGMIKALLSILKLFSLINPEGELYYFLSFIADAGYYFLPVYLAASAARKFHCNMFMSMLLGAMLLHPNFSALGESGDIISVIGLPVRIVTYSSSVIPILLIVLVYSYVEKIAEKVVPSIIKFIAKPLLSLLIMAPIAFCVLGPLGGFLGDALVSGLLAIQDVIPWALPTIIGAFMPFLVMTGMHYSLLPAYVNSLSALGYETIIGPGNLPSNIAQGAAALCVALKTKNREFRQLAISSGVTALLGVTEPALFGVNLRLKRPLIAMAIGGGLGGLYAGLTGVLRFGGGGAGLAAIGLYVGPNPMNVTNALISCAIAFVATFVLMWFIGFEDIPADEAVDDPMEALSK